MAVDDLHHDRARAESFGSVAAQYDRYRPAPPGALIDDLAALRPTLVLDVGCGTGKAAVALAERGISVLGLEPDERMAEVARGHGIAVEVATFENWDETGRRFDLLTFADSWHWITPAAGIPKAARLLNEGGTFVRFWNAYAVDGPVIDAFDTVYREHAPEVAQVWRPTGDRARMHGVASSGAFHSLETRTYRWERILTADEWVAATATVSDHQRLGPQRLTRLLGELHETIEHLGGTVHAHYETYLALARHG